MIIYAYILNANKFMNVRRYILKSNPLTDAGKDIKEQVIVDIQRNESVAIEMNAVNNEIDNT